MSQLHWYERLHWRAFVVFVGLLVILIAPVWYGLVGLQVEPDAAALVERAIAATVVVALVVAGITALVGRAYMRRRVRAMTRELAESVRGEERLRFGRRDELQLVVDELSEVLGALRDRLRRLEQEKGRLSVLLEGMGEAVLMIDERERILLANPVAERLLDLPRRYDGRRLADVGGSVQLNDVVANVLWSGQPTLVDVDFPQQGDMRHMSVSVAPLREKDETVGAVVVLYDVTRLRRLERVRRDFVANVSHELRTPIASIKSAGETLLYNDLVADAVAVEFVEAMARNADRMAMIVDDLLTLSRLEAAGDDLTLQSVELPAVFAEVLDRSDPLAREAGIALHVELDEGLPGVVGERNALCQVLQNLVENAIKYTPGGGEVHLSADARGDRVVIRVEDTGVGIPAEHLPRIFERFYRVDAGRSREVGGTGLGLAIVKHLVRKLGGTIDVQSRRGATVFEIGLRAIDRTRRGEDDARSGDDDENDEMDETDGTERT